MTDSTVDTAIGATTGLLALGIMAGVAGRMMGPQQQPRRMRTRARARPIRMRMRKPVVKRKYKKLKFI